MANAFDSVTKIAKMAGKTKAYNKLRYEVSTDVHAVSTILIVKEVLLVDTRAVTEVPVITTGPTHIVNTNKLQRIIHPSKAVVKNQHVITVRVYII